MINPQIHNCINYFNKLILNELQDKKENTYSQDKPIKVYVAGGCIRDYFLKENTTSDIDLFFFNEQELNKAKNYFSKYLAKRDLSKFIYENDNATGFLYKNKKFDLVKSRYFNNLEEIKIGFDFSVCCAAISENKFICHDNYFIDLATKRLMIEKITYPISTLQRIQKYVKKGFTICNENLLILAKEISKMELHNNNKPQEQLEFYEDGAPKFIGVD